MNGIGLEWFDQFTAQEWVDTPGGVTSVWLILLMSFCIGQIIGWVYMRTHTGLSYSRTFTVALAVLPMIVAVVLMIMIDNIIIAFGLFAVFAIVRFRNIVKDTRDTSFVLWAIIAGMSIGSMRFSLAVISTVALALTYFYFRAVGFGVREQFDVMLSVQWSGPTEQLNTLREVMQRHARKMELANQHGGAGSVISFTYHLLMRDPNRSEELITELQSVEGVADASLYRREDESEI